VSFPRWNVRHSFVRRFLTIGILIAASNYEAHADTRIALVIGNGSYSNASPLTNPPNDAKLIAQSLRTDGFTVIQKQDVGLAEFQRAVLQFGRTAGSADVAMVYYAGHAIQFNGENYLIPVDAKLDDDLALRIEALNLDLILDAVSNAKTRLIVLDACRNSPFTSHMTVSGAGRSIGRGLARVEAVDGGTLIAFSTSPGTIAEDGSGSNSIFAAALAQYLLQPGLEIRQVFTRVRQTVAANTTNHQTPWENSSLFGDLFLSGQPGKIAEGVPGPTVADSVPPPPLVPSAPVRGMWAVTLTCPNGSAVNEQNANFDEGLYSRGFRTSDVVGRTELAMGFEGGNRIHLVGYIVFGKSDVYPVDAVGDAVGNSYSGTGSFGASTNCRLAATRK